MLEHEYSSNSISGIKASSGGPAITHVMYADDIFLFSKANRLEAARIMACVDKYCKWSGQMIIRGKSGVFFFSSKSTQIQTRRCLKNMLHMKGLKKDVVYLGAL